MPMKIHRLAVVTLLALASGCGGGMPDFDYRSLKNPTKGEYVIGPADRLRITVWKNPDLSTEVTVRPDGTITMPLLGDLDASDKTPTRLRKEIGQQLQQYVKDPSAVVTVEVVEVNSYRFTVSGEVNQNGVFSAKRYVTVVEAINMAGGFTRFAERGNIKVVRCCKQNGDKIRIPINYSAILKDGNTEMNIYLLAGDEVYVP